MRIALRLLLALVVAAGIAAPAQAVFLVQYTTPGSPASLAPTTVDANVSADSLNFAGSSTSVFPFPGVAPINILATSIDPVTAVADASYFQFTVAPNPGFVMNLGNLSFDSAFGIAGAGWAVTSSADGFASIIDSGLTATGFPTFTTDVVDLSGPLYQMLGSPTTFRIYTFSPTFSNPANGYTNITLNGDTAPVPLPPAIVMFGLGLTMLRLRRFQRG